MQLALFFYLFVSAIFAGPPLPQCGFGNHGLFYTTESFVFNDYNGGCASAGGQAVELLPHTNSDSDLLIWLHLRRGLRACGVAKAFAYNSAFKKNADVIRGCCVVTPGGVSCYNVCPVEEALPSLCMQNS